MTLVDARTCSTWVNTLSSSIYQVKTPPVTSLAYTFYQTVIAMITLSNNRSFITYYGEQKEGTKINHIITSVHLSRWYSLETR